VVEQLDSLSIPVFAANSVDMESTMRSIQAIGEVLNAGPRTGEIVADMRRRIRYVAGHPRHIPPAA
jgi:ABC-type Fe3+-hydroxamate transport system substrate-binding protein